MCEATVKLKVPCEVFSCNDWNMAEIDQCIAPIVETLNAANIYTMSSCCGHGKERGYIWLKDGRILIILPAGTTKEEVGGVIYPTGQ